MDNKREDLEALAEKIREEELRAWKLWKLVTVSNRREKILKEYKQKDEELKNRKDKILKATVIEEEEGSYKSTADALYYNSSGCLTGTVAYGHNHNFKG